MHRFTEATEYTSPLNQLSVEAIASVLSVVHCSRPSTIAISSFVNPYNSYTSASISASVASIWRW
jgi:hypothetical protein